MVAIFPLPAWIRLLVALGYGLVVGLLVWAVEGGTRMAPSAVPAVRAATSVEVRAEATFAVARWTVLADGVTCTGRSDGRTWHGTVAGHEVLVQAERADGGQDAGALRVLGAGREALAWGEGTVSAVLKAGR